MALSRDEYDRRARRLIGDAIDAIEDFADRYDHKDEEFRLMLVQLLAGLALTFCLRRQGPIRWLRTVAASAVIAVRYRKLFGPVEANQ